MSAWKSETKCQNIKIYKKCRQNKILNTNKEKYKD